MAFTKPKRFKLIIIRAAFITFISSALGLIVNLVSPARIPFIYHPPLKITLPGGDARVIGTDEAQAIFREGKAVFIDARSRKDYRNGHISGAFSIPWNEPDPQLEHFLSIVPPVVKVIVYCQGEECTESHVIADILMQMEYRDILIFSEGFPAWKRAGLPVEKGKGE
ncbi:MAG: hypothetical protein JRI22_14610 [Deltaproteobacteria bacterium]|nr:hypothetical protein [Deltaproteobacteria bacterium]